MNWDELEKTLAEATEGPWRYDGNGETRVIRDADNSRLAQIGHLRGKFGRKGRLPDSEARGNARLIAQTPDLARLALAGRKLAGAMAEIEIFSAEAEMALGEDHEIANALNTIGKIAAAALAEWRELEGEQK